MKNAKQIWLYGPLAALATSGMPFHAKYRLAVAEDGFFKLENGDALDGLLVDANPELVERFNALHVDWLVVDEHETVFAPVSSAKLMSENARDIAWFSLRLQAFLGAFFHEPDAVKRRTLAFGWRYRVASFWLAKSDMGSTLPPENFEITNYDASHRGFYNLEILHYRHELFRGGQSPELRREIISAGDGVFILPYDPVLDKVLLIEQVRPGPMARGAQNANSFEVIAGLIGIGELPEETARREAEEEAGLMIGRVFHLPGAYQSPGLATQYGYALIGEVDLSKTESGVFGLASEGEDIRTWILDFDEAIDMMDAGKTDNAPVQICLLSLIRHRETLRQKWGN